MPLTYRIFPSHGLVYVRYEGFALLDETISAFSDYAAHPDWRPGQKQLVDLSRVTGFERNFPKLFELQARKADQFYRPGVETLIVYLATTPTVWDMCRSILRSWEGVRGVVPRVQDTEAGALAILGLSETRIADFLERSE